MVFDRRNGEERVVLVDNCKKEYDFPTISMKIILPAGDARSKASEAMDAAMKNDFDLAHQLMKEAHECIKEAHRAQTETMQAMAMDEYNNGNDTVALPMLFIHAQDTIMTIMTEVNLTEKMIQMYQKIREEMDQCKK